MIKLSDYIAKRLKEHGVELFFMVSGGGAMHLNNSLGKVIPYITCHHEQACAIAAEGYARVNQKLAVVNVTTGPGGLNCLNGLFGEWTDSVPVLYISGQVKCRTMMSSFPDLPLRQLGDQEVDIISIVKPLTKYAVCVKNPNEIKYHLDKAIYEATTGRKGPVWLDIPIDVQASMIEESDLNNYEVFSPSIFAMEGVNELSNTESSPSTNAREGVNELSNTENSPSPLAGEGWGEGYNYSNPSHRYYAPYIKEFARELRTNQTNEEQKLWTLIRNSQTGYKFRRQFSIDNKYVADFVCLEKRLIIEIDGGQHLESEYDSSRTMYLQEKDFRIIRFWNNEINNNIDGCYKRLLDELNTPHPNPLPQGARESTVDLVHLSTLSQGARENALDSDACFTSLSQGKGEKYLAQSDSVNVLQNLQNDIEFKIKEILSRLESAKYPVIIAGHGIRLAGMIEEFKKLVNMLNIPVVTTLNGFDIVESDNPYYIGRIGTIGQRAGNFVLQNSDLIICLGTRNNIRQVSYNWENFGKNAYKIIVDIDKAELNKPLVKPDMAVCADLKNFLPIMINTITDSVQDSYKNIKHAHNDWLKFCQNLKNKYSFENHPETVQEDKIEPYHFTYELTKCLKENDIIVMANATPTICMFQNTIVKTGQRYITNSGDASMGYGLPAAIGACCYVNTPHSNPASPQNCPLDTFLSAELQGAGKDRRRVICLEGDGSIMMNIQELQTIKHYNLPIKLFIIKNNGYSSIRQSQKNYFEGHMTGSGVESGVSVPNFTEVGKAFGLKSIKINNPKTMREDIQNILNASEPILCEVETIEEYSFLPKLSSKILPDGTMVSASLEDMYPFIKIEQYK